MTTGAKLRKEEAMLANKDVTDWVKNGPSNTLINKVNKFSENIAKDVPTAQIRQVFTKMRAIEAKGGMSKPNQQIDFLMLKPKLAYAAGRHGKNGITVLKERLTEGIDAVLELDSSEEQQKRFKNFCLLFEAILSYHKAHGGN